MKRIRLVLSAVALLALPRAASGGQAAPGATTQPAGADANRIVRSGVVAEFSIAPIAAGDRKDLMEGDSVEVKFRLTDEATSNALGSLAPGAWMDPGTTLQARGAREASCKEKVSLYLKNIVGMRPMLDLNSHFLLVLNQDASISVIDPRGGISGTNLFASIPLKRPGGDWTKSRDNKRLYVSMPGGGQVAAVSTENFKIIGNVDTGADPLRIVLQADEKYLWVGNDAPEASRSGVTVIDAASLSVAANIATGGGHHEIVLTADDRYAFVSNRDEGTVSVIDTQQLKKVKDLATGPQPISLAYSPLSRAVYVADGKSGVISVLDSLRHVVLARIPAKPGLGPLRFTPDGRWGLVVNTTENAVHVVDAATNRLAYTIPVGAQPYQISFTRAFAHVRSLATEHVSMINLAALGQEAVPPPNTFGAGASAPNKVPELGLAPAIMPAVGEAAVYVASPGDNAIYYYMEGMNAPSGSFQTYGHKAQGIEIIDRSLREQEPGVYATRVKLPVAGTYDVAFILDSPRMVHCFAFSAKPNPGLKRRGPSLGVEYLTEERNVPAGEKVQFSFRLKDPESGQPRPGLKDVRLLYYMVPGIHRTEVPVQEVSDGIYETTLAFPQAGAYYLYLASPSAKVRYGDLPYRTLMAMQEKPAAGQGVAEEIRK